MEKIQAQKDTVKSKFRLQPDVSSASEEREGEFPSDLPEEMVVESTMSGSPRTSSRSLGFESPVLEHSVGDQTVAARSGAPLGMHSSQSAPASSTFNPPPHQPNKPFHYDTAAEAITFNNVNKDKQTKRPATEGFRGPMSARAKPLAKNFKQEVGHVHA